jgi:hypothetical protein
MRLPLLAIAMRSLLTAAIRRPACPVHSLQLSFWQVATRGNLNGYSRSRTLMRSRTVGLQASRVDLPSRGRTRRLVLYALGTTLRAASVVLSLTLLASAGDQKAEQQLWSAAQECSGTALRRYALSSTDPAEKIAEAAFDKCIDLWQRATDIDAPDVEAVGAEAQRNCKRLRGSACPPSLPATVYLMDAARRSFVAQATPTVFDVRAEAVERQNASRKP